MDPATFIHKWKPVELSERAASQEHFIDLCRLLGVKTPAELDPTGDTFTFEKGVAVAGPASAGSSGQRGFADVWYKGRFGWEYKRRGKYKTLDEALRQLLQYRDALENPPLLIVSDIARTEIHTNFTGYRSDTHVIELEDLHQPDNLKLLKRAFTEPEWFRPKETTEQVTEQAANNIGAIAQGLRERGHDPHDAAHFLMKVMFCLFAEDVDLLPKGLFETILSRADRQPARLKTQMDALFAAMREGGDFGVDEIAYFNGGLFDGTPALELTDQEIKHLISAAEKDWGSVEPSVFGTLFERSLDPDKRAQIGAHYTSKGDIMLVIEPVIVRPLKKLWAETESQIDAQLDRRRSATTAATKKKADDAIAELLAGYQDRLASVRVLDPACGSGNFLYVAIQQLLQLEKDLIMYASRPEIAAPLLPRVRPTQLAGIEINTYAAELAQVVIWIGYLQWMHANGFNAPRNPILEPITTIENRDAILAWETEDGEPLNAWREGAVCTGQAEWPAADFIVGNPPFLGSKMFRGHGIPDGYLDALYASSTLPSTSDLCCYWFELAHRLVESTPQSRAALIATQGIRGSSNRRVLERISEQTGIRFAWADKEWVLDGASVRVSIIGFWRSGDDESELDGTVVPTIGASLQSGFDAAATNVIPSQEGLVLMGTTKGGAFDLEWLDARSLLAQPNAVEQANLKVLRPWVNASEITRRRTGKWIIDFGADMDLAEAAMYEAPFGRCKELVWPVRKDNRRESYAKYWWRHVEPRPALRTAVKALDHVILTPRVAKHRIFVMAPQAVCPDSRLFVVASDSLTVFGALQSSIHELWTLNTCSWHGDGSDGGRPTYNATTCFETFPLPWPPGSEPAEGEPGRDLHDAIAAAAETLNAQRERWLNPPEWIEEVAATIDAEDDFADVARVSGEEARRLIRQSAIDAAAAKHPKLKKRTLTNLYNERPTWLRLAHKALDEAVLAAYARIDPEGGWESSWADVFEDTGAGQPLPEGHELTERRAEVEQLILAALLRLNHERAGGPGSS